MRMHARNTRSYSHVLHQAWTKQPRLGLGFQLASVVSADL